jgi:hypothetical protein
MEAGISTNKWYRTLHGAACLAQLLRPAFNTPRYEVFSYKQTQQQQLKPPRLVVDRPQACA